MAVFDWISCITLIIYKHNGDEVPKNPRDAVPASMLTRFGEQYEPCCDGENTFSQCM
jgi:hypothetical protein